MFRRSINFCFILTLLFAPPLSGRGQHKTSDLHDPVSSTPFTGLRLSRSDVTGVDIELNVPTYKLIDGPDGAENTKELFLDGAGRSSDIGKPELPTYSALIGVPPDAQIELRVISDVFEPIEGHFNLSPVPRADSVSEDTTSAKLVYDRDESVYTANTLYPATTARKGNDAWLRDLRVVRIELNPFQYNPLNGSLVWHKYLKVAVKINSGILTGSSGNISPDNATFDALFQGVVMNYDVAREWRGVPPGEIYHPKTSGQASEIGNYDPVFLGPRYKIVVDHDSLYRLTYEALQQVQPLSNIHSNTFHLYNQGRDVAMYINDGGDGLFGINDSLYFYGEQFRGDYMAQRYALESSNWITLTEQLTNSALVPWHPQFNHFMLEKYTDQNVYWLTVDGVGGPLMLSIDGDPSGSTDPIPVTYQATIHAEPELRHWEQSFTTEDTWYWDFVTDLNTHIFTTTLTGLAPGVFTATVRAEMAAYSYNADYSPDHHTRFFLNNRVDPIDDAYWDGKSRYSFNAQVSQSDLLEGVNQLQFININDAYAYPFIAFDFFEVNFTRLFQAIQNKLIFPGESAGTWRYHTGGFTTSSITAYDVTNPVSPVRITNPSVAYANGSYSATFLVTHAANVKYLVAGGFEAPNSLTYYQPPDFAAMSEGAEYLIISHADFIPTAQALLDFRSSQGLSTMIINVDDLYAEFNDGIFHPLAIKNFLAYTFSHWVNPPTYVLLIGDGNWHMKNTNPAHYGAAPTYMPPNLSWVDPWLGQTDSPNLLAAVVGNDILPDVLIGRLPVSSSAELTAIISKITSYEQSSPQSWQRNLLFIADDTPDQAGDFVQQSETIINEFVRSGFTPLRIYLDDYKDNNLCGTQPFPLGPTCTPVNRAITETVSTTGTLFVNYTGHGSTQFWTSDKILLYQVENPGVPNDYNINDIASMQNGSKLPVVLSMTCWDGYWFYPIAHPAQPSLSEFWLRTSGRGAVAVFAATGLGVEAGHVNLQQGFYGAIFDDGIWNLGSAALGAKINVYQSGGNYDLINTYVTFGDPALHFLSPYQVGLTPHAREGMALPGNSVTYTFQVTNQGTIADTFAPSFTNNNWPANFPTTIGPLSPGQSQSFDVIVNIPAGTDGGITDTATLNITSLGDRSRKDTATIITHSKSVYGVLIDPPSASQFNLPGSTAIYNFQVTNTGNHEDTFVISTGSHQWQVSIPATVGPVPRGQTVVLPVTVHIPADAQDWDADQVLIQVTSQTDPGKTASSQLTTTARLYGVAFTPPSASIEAPQGTTVTYTLHVNNIGGYSDTFTVTVNSQWAAQVSPIIIGPIGPTQSADVKVSIDIPTGLPGGSYDEAVVTATSWGDTSRTGHATLRTIGNIYGLIVRPAYSTQVSLPGSTVTYTLQITNTSNVSDSFDLVLGHHDWPVTLSDSAIGPLNENGGTATFTVTVDIPQGSPDRAADSIVITVTSHTIPDRVAIATLDTTARLYGVTILPPDMVKEGLPGEKVVYSLTVTNSGGYLDTYTVTATGGWLVETNSPFVGPLEPDSAEKITVTVQIPNNAVDATNFSTVKVTSWGDPSIHEQATLATTSKLYGVALNMTHFSGFGLPGEDVIYELQVTNTSNNTDTFTVEISSAWLIKVEPVWIGPLSPHTVAKLKVVVSIPIDAERGINSVATLWVTSRADAAKQAEAFLTTYVDWRHVYLPVVQK